MTGIVVSDASPLHYLILVGAVDYLPRLFEQVIIPSAVAAELTQPNTPPLVSGWAGQPLSWLKVVRAQAVDQSLNLDAGETEAISLALNSALTPYSSMNGKEGWSPPNVASCSLAPLPSWSASPGKAGLTSIRPLLN